MNARLAKLINKMAAEDQNMRKGHKKGVKLDIGMDKRHAEELKLIIKQHGWPTISLVGKKASNNAWLIAQHADHDLKFQKIILRLLLKIDKESHDVNRANIAYLTDRIAVNEKRKQRFGTQFYFTKNGSLILCPLAHLRGIDKLRKEYVLPTLEEYLKMARDFFEGR